MLEQVRSDRSRILKLTKETATSPLCSNTHTPMILFLPLLHPLSLALFSLTAPGSEPDIPVGPGSLKWLVGVGSRFRGRDRRKPICLAEENSPGPGVNQQTQHTAHSVHRRAHIHTDTNANTAYTVPAAQL